MPVGGEGYVYSELFRKAGGPALLYYSYPTL